MDLAGKADEVTGGVEPLRLTPSAVERKGDRRTFSGQCVLGAVGWEGLEKSPALPSPLVQTGTWILACSGCTELCVCTAAT